MYSYKQYNLESQNMTRQEQQHNLVEAAPLPLPALGILQQSQYVEMMPSGANRIATMNRETNNIIFGE